MSVSTLEHRAPASTWDDERDEMNRLAHRNLAVAAQPNNPLAVRAAARDRVITMYLPMTHRLARRFHGGGEPVDDLQQVAAIGLIRAVDRFDPDRGRCFAAYAIPTVVGELRRHFRDRVYDVRIPRTVQERVMRVRAARAALEQRLGRAPDVPEVAAEIGMTEEDVVEAVAGAAARNSVPIDPSQPHFGRHWLSDDDPGLERAELRATVRTLLATLPARERRIVWLRYFEDLTQTEIAERVGISQMHVSRLLERAVTAMREHAGATAPA